MRRGGYTLLEMMTVVAIAGIMAAIAGINLQRALDNQRASAAARDVYNVVLQARNKARIANTYTRVAFKPDAGGMRWEVLPCSNRWSGTCPSSTCDGVTSAACSDNGGSCTCTEVSPWVEIPRQLSTDPDGGVQVSGLANLCFQGGTGAPRRASGTFSQCNTGAALTTVTGNFNFKESNPARQGYMLNIEPATGFPRFLDCGKAPKDDLCP